MARLSVDVPESLKKQLEETSKRENYQNPSEYVRQALREKLKEDEELDPELLLRALKLKEGEVETQSIEEVIDEFSDN